MAGQQLKNLEKRISRTFQLGINYRCVKFQWSPIKKVLWREVKQNIQWLFKRTRVLTFRRSHLSFKFPNSVSNFSNKILGIVWKCWSYRFNLSPKNKKFLEQNLWQANVHVHCQRKLFLKVSLFSEIVGFVHTSQPIESQQTVFSNFSANRGKNLETAFCMREVPIMIKKELTREQI